MPTPPPGRSGQWRAAQSLDSLPMTGQLREFLEFQPCCLGAGRAWDTTGLRFASQWDRSGIQRHLRSSGERR